ncbi:phage terminase large subunit [Enterocloster citroniae]|nr:phage terminase large subunit [Enterocloster citroniae]MCB7064129.1 phage terminase large subunit [Enterocloster citroniae]
MMQRKEFEALFGGSAGGGKSDYLLVEALRQVHIKHYRAVILRKTFPELEDLISRSKELYGVAFPRAKYNESKHVWTFPSGAKIYFSNMQHERDKIKYQGRHFDFVGFDELTHFSWDEYNYLFSRTRSSGPGLRAYIRATANPGGPGHGWVKARFITAMKPETPIREKTEVKDPAGNAIETESDRIFIPSSLFDNADLMRNNPHYLASLAMLPEAQRNALLYGDWNSFSGQVFEEWKNDPDGYDTQQWSHAINPFRVPDGWEIMRGYDHGYAKPFSVGWYAVDYTGCIYRIRELYGMKKGCPNVGLKIEPAAVAKQIRAIEETDPNLKGRRITGIADPSIFAKDRGESIADIMAKAGVYWAPGDNHRIAGKMQCHYRMAFDEHGRSMFYVFKNCKDFIRTIPDLVYDEQNVEDVDTKQEDHIYDECRYVLMSRIIAIRKNIEKPLPLEDPLDLYKEEREQRSRVIRV